MNQNPQRHGYGDGFITAVAFGGVLVIVGAIFFSTPGLWDRVTDFFSNITSSNVPFGGATSDLILPAPANPAAHKVLYNAVFQFDVAFGVLQLLILGLRVWVRSATRRIAETVGNAVFWFGAALLVNMFLLTGTLSGWFEYWSALIVVIGFSLIARALVHFARRK